MPDPVTCSNCDRMIGRLEEAYLWKDQPICQECHQRLAGGSRQDLPQKDRSEESTKPAPVNVQVVENKRPLGILDGMNIGCGIVLILIVGVVALIMLVFGPCLF